MTQEPNECCGAFYGCDKCKNKQETLEDITEQLQDECHKFVASLTNVNYQDATNLFLFLKLAELTLKLNK